MANVDIYQMTTKDTNHKVAPVTIFDAVVNPLNKKTLDQEFEDMVGAVDENVALDNADETLVTTALRKTNQILTLAEQTQARTNIGAASATDLTELSTTVSENKTETDGKLTELATKLYSINTYKKDGYWVYETYVANQANSSIYQIPVVFGMIVSVTANDKREASFSFTENDASTNPGASRIIVPINETTELSVPKNAKYIVFNKEDGNNYHTTPLSIKINGIELFKTIESEIELTNKYIDTSILYNLNDNTILGYWIYEYGIQKQENACIANIPISNGDKITIKANKYRDASFILSENELGSGERVVISSNSDYQFIANKKFLYININDDVENFSAIPESITINGIDLLNSLSSTMDEHTNNPVITTDISSQSINDITEMDWNVVSSYRNLSLWPSNPSIDIDFSKQHINRFVKILQLKGTNNIEIINKNNGITFINNADEDLSAFYLLPCSPFLSAITIGAIFNSCNNAECGIGIIKDDNNYLCTYNSTIGKKYVLEELIDGVKNIISSKESTETRDFELYLNWGNSYASSFNVIDDVSSCIGEGKIGISQKIEEIRNYRVGLYISLPPNSQVSCKTIKAGVTEGFGHADFRCVTYENGEPVIKDGCFYVTSSSRIMGINGGNGAITIYKISKNLTNIKPVSYIGTNRDGFYETGTAAKLVYDRGTKAWIYIGRHNPAGPGGMLYIGISKENLLNQGNHIIDIKSLNLRPYSLDADLIKYNNIWYIAYHDGLIDHLIISKSENLVDWREIIDVSSGEGITIAKFNSKHYIIDARGHDRLGISLLDFENETLTYMSDWILKDNPGINGEGGNSWGCIVPIYDGKRTTFNLIVFTRDLYSNNLLENFSYGNMWLYQSSKKWLGVSEFKESFIKYLGW